MLPILRIDYFTSLFPCITYVVYYTSSEPRQNVHYMERAFYILLLDIPKETCSLIPSKEKLG